VVLQPDDGSAGHQWPPARGRLLPTLLQRLRSPRVICRRQVGVPAGRRPAVGGSAALLQCVQRRAAVEAGKGRTGRQCRDAVL
ncbi:MAG: hypothetical protein ACK5V0_09925, partial [Alphaproteobacteria bacterium]